MSSAAPANSKLIKKVTIAKKLSTNNGYRMNKNVIVCSLAVLLLLTATTQVVLCGKINKTVIPSPLLASIGGSFDDALQYLTMNS